MFSYEDLDVFKKASQVNRLIYQFLRSNKKIEDYLKNQLGRAALSVMLNLAEGSAKFSRRDRKNFFVIARGSAFETAAIISFLYHIKEIPGAVKTELYQVVEEISGML